MVCSLLAHSVSFSFFLFFLLFVWHINILQYFVCIKLSLKANIKLFLYTDDFLVHGSPSTIIYQAFQELSGA